MAGFPPVFVCLTPNSNIVTRYILQRRAPRKLTRTHAGRRQNNALVNRYPTGY